MGLQLEEIRGSGDGRAVFIALGRLGASDYSSGPVDEYGRR